MAQSQVKENLEKVITECFKKAEQKNFRDLNFSFPKNKTPKQFLKLKIDTLYNIDEYSAHFLSIHTKAKIALREFRQVRFEGAYLELLILVLNLSDKLNRPNLKAIRVYDKNELPEMIAGNDITVEPSAYLIAAKESSKEIEEVKVPQLNPVMKNTRLIKEGTTGKKLKRNLTSLDESIENLKDIEL